MTDFHFFHYYFDNADKSHNNQKTGLLEHVRDLEDFNLITKENVVNKISEDMICLANYDSLQSSLNRMDQSSVRLSDQVLVALSEVLLSRALVSPEKSHAIVAEEVRRGERIALMITLEPSIQVVPQFCGLLTKRENTFRMRYEYRFSETPVSFSD